MDLLRPGFRTSFEHAIEFYSLKILGSSFGKFERVSCPGYHCLACGSHGVALNFLIDLLIKSSVSYSSSETLIQSIKKAVLQIQNNEG